jgi:hypothetical protein
MTGNSNSGDGSDGQHIVAQKTVINDTALEPGKRYTVTIHVQERDEPHNSVVRLPFEDASGAPRAVSILNWQTDIDDSVFRAGMTVTISAVAYEISEEGFHNLNPTRESEILEIVPTDQYQDNRGQESENSVSASSDDTAEVDDGGDDSGYETEDAIDDALSDIREPTDSGHGLTSYRTSSTITDLDVTVYQVRTTDDVLPDKQEKRTLTYRGLRACRWATDAPLAMSGTLEFVASEPFDPASVNLEPFEKIDEVVQVDTTTLDASDTADNDVLERLIEEAIKRGAEQEGYDALAIDKILDPDPINVDSETDHFTLHDRYECGVELTPQGQVVLHIEARTKVVSHLTLDQLDLSELPRGTRLVTTYGGRKGYYFNKVLDVRATDPYLEDGKSVFEYHNAREEISDAVIEQIWSNDRKVVEGIRMGRGGPTPLPQELLAIQSHPENTKFYDPTFHTNQRTYQFRTPDKRVRYAREFIEEVSGCSIDGIELQFQTQPPILGGRPYRVTRLYDTEAEILKFGNGQVGNSASDASTYGVFEAPPSFRVGFIHPERLSDDRLDRYWRTVERACSDLGVNPVRAADISYEAPMDDSDLWGVSTEIQSSLNPDHDLDVGLGLLPPKEGQFGFENPYDPIKRAGAKLGLPSQGIHVDTFDGRYFKTNTALGLIAAAGGIPFTLADGIPGPSELVIGLDVGQAYDGRDDANESPTDGIRVGASTVAIMNDGTVLGYTNTGAQTGERIPSRELLDIVEQDVVGFRRLEGGMPAHVTIMRDGFMNDPIGEALDYLSNQGIGYDVVEVRKQAKTRLVNRNTTFDHPDRGVAAISTYEPRAVLATYGKPMHGRTDGTPRPITIERTDGTTDIETLARQVYLLSQCHVSSANATLRIPTPVAYADRAATAAANKHLPSTSSLETKLGFL